MASRPPSDLDGDGEAADTLALVVTRATDGWVVLADTDGDGSLAGERPVLDYRAWQAELRLGVARGTRRV